MYGGIDYKVENDREGEKVAKIGKFYLSEEYLQTFFECVKWSNSSR